MIAALQVRLVSLVTVKARRIVHRRVGRGDSRTYIAGTEKMPRSLKSECCFGHHFLLGLFRRLLVILTTDVIDLDHPVPESGFSAALVVV